MKHFLVCFVALVFSHIALATTDKLPCVNFMEKYTSPLCVQFAPEKLVYDGFGTDEGWKDINEYPRLLIDITGNGLLDIVGFNATGVVVAENLGQGKFAEAKEIIKDFGINTGWKNQSEYPRLLADITGNGLVDIIGFGSKGVLVAENLGNGQFAEPKIVMNGFNIAAGWKNQTTGLRMLIDMTGNGLVDLVGFNSRFSTDKPPELVIAKNFGDGTFTTPKITLVEGLLPYPITLGSPARSLNVNGFMDITGNSLPDLTGITFGQKAWPLGLIKNLGDDTYSAPYHIAPDTFDLRKYNLFSGTFGLPVDMTGNGLADFVQGAIIKESSRIETHFPYPSYTKPSLVVKNLGQGHFSPPQEFSLVYPIYLSTETNTFSQTLDINGNGLTDLLRLAQGQLYANINMGPPPPHTPSTDSYWISIVRVGQTSQFKKFTDLLNDQNKYPIMFADITGNGFLDLVQFRANGVAVAENLGVVVNQ